MINIKKVVARLEDNEYDSLAQNLKDNKAEKFLILLTILKEGDISDNKIRETLGISQNAYYTLKSRLYEKIQDFLINSLEGPKIELLRKVASIPTLVYNTNRDRAKAVLTKMEKDLSEHDMPYELITVYNALKKLHMYSPKYYEYTQLYNKHVAYTLALDKVEDLISEFNKKLGDYFLTRDPAFIEILKLIKDEINNVCQLYDSHHLYIFKAMANISFALYVPDKEAIEDDEPIEDVLDKMNEIIQDYPNDINYQYLKLVYNYYAFEYYHQHNIHKKEAPFFQKVNDQLPTFLLYNFAACPSQFLISKIHRYINTGMAAEMYKENVELARNYKADSDDIPNYVQYTKYMAASAFYAGDFEESIDLLNKLLNKVSLRNYAHTDIEIKLFMALLYCMTNEYNLAENLLRSVSRKILERTDIDYENVKTLIKIIQVPMKSKANESNDKILQMRDRFNLLNQTDYSVLEFLSLDDDFMMHFAKPIKETA